MKTGHLVKLPKKANLVRSKNWQGVMLPSVPGKVMTRILLERQGGSVHKKLTPEQAGFRKNRSWADQVATLRIVVEQFMEWQAPLHLHFLDFEKTSDSVDCKSDLEPSEAL